MSKGITPVIATVLLLMMTVAASGAAYLWMTSLQSEIQKSVQQTAQGVTGTTDLEFQFRSKKCNATESSPPFTHNEIEVYLQNTGQGLIEQGPVGLTLVDDEGNDLEFVERTDAMTKDFEVNKYLFLGFNVTTDLVENEEYILRISLPGGVVGSQICTARE
jgi:flagellin-like protein